ncbi:unnamed protein product, partial [Meganyctiphanes norvegica]
MATKGTVASIDSYESLAHTIINRAGSSRELQLPEELIRIRKTSMANDNVESKPISAKIAEVEALPIHPTLSHQCMIKANTNHICLELLVRNQHHGETNKRLDEARIDAKLELLQELGFLSSKTFIKNFIMTVKNNFIIFTVFGQKLLNRIIKIIFAWSNMVKYSFGGILNIAFGDKSVVDPSQNSRKFLRYRALRPAFVEVSCVKEVLCEQFPADEDLENQAWNFLTWGGHRPWNCFSRYIPYFT